MHTTSAAKPIAGLRSPSASDTPVATSSARAAIDTATSAALSGKASRRLRRSSTAENAAKVTKAAHIRTRRVSSSPAGTSAKISAAATPIAQAMPKNIGPTSRRTASGACAGGTRGRWLMLSGPGRGRCCGPRVARAATRSAGQRRAPCYAVRFSEATSASCSLRASIGLVRKPFMPLASA